MAYEITWDTPRRVLHLRLSGEPSLEVFTDINRQINCHLQQSSGPVTLIFDASGAKISPYSIERIRDSQTYLHDNKLDQLVVISESKLNRLAMLLLFNLCRPRLHFCEDLVQAQRTLTILARAEARRF